MLFEMNPHPSHVKYPGLTNPSFSDRFSNIDVSLPVSNTIPYTDTMSFNQKPIVDYSV